MTAVPTRSTPPVIPVTELTPSRATRSGATRSGATPPRERLTRPTRLRAVALRAASAPTVGPVPATDPLAAAAPGAVSDSAAPSDTAVTPASAQGERSEVEQQTATLLERIAVAVTEDERAGLVEQVVLLNLPLADAMARRFRHRGEEEDDLLQVARSGLTEAVLRYQPDRGPFGGFAVPTVLGVLKRHFRDRGWMVRPPRHQQEVVLSIRRVWPELTQQLGAEPTDVQLAEHLGETVQTISQARLAEQGYRPAAVDLHTADHGLRGAVSRGDGLRGSGEDAALAACEARLLVDEAVAGLDDADRRLIWMRFHQERTQSDIAAELGTSQMQVSRLLARVMARLRTSIGSLEDAEPGETALSARGQSSARSQVHTSGAPRSST